MGDDAGFQILCEGWLARAGAGVFSKRFHDRYCVLLGGPYSTRLVCYTEQDQKSMRGQFRPVAAAKSLGCPYDSFALPMRAEGGSSRLETARFRAATDAEASRYAL